MRKLLCIGLLAGIVGCQGGDSLPPESGPAEPFELLQSDPARLSDWMFERTLIHAKDPKPEAQILEDGFELRLRRPPSNLIPSLLCGAALVRLKRELPPSGRGLELVADFTVLEKPAAGGYWLKFEILRNDSRQLILLNEEGAFVAGPVELLKIGEPLALGHHHLKARFIEGTTEVSMDDRAYGAFPRTFHQERRRARNAGLFLELYLQETSPAAGALCTASVMRVRIHTVKLGFVSE